jgi:DNA sulfur modification protein DndE
MAKRLKLSPNATEQMYRVKSKLNIDKKDDLWTLRIALARSLQIGGKFKITDEISEEGTGKRKEIDVATLVQKDGLIFKALLNQFYNKNLTEDEYEIFLVRHIEHGLEVIDNETKKFSGFDYLAHLAKKGMIDINKPIKDDSQPRIEIVEGYEDVIKLRIGVEKDSNEPVYINFNKTDEHNNNYMGIIGKPGSGKTYFIKYLLKELRKNTNYQTNFIIFDYAKGDIADDKEFIGITKAQLINMAKTPLPLNIFKLQNINYQEIRFSAERVVRIVRDVEANIGKVQEQNLYDSIVTSYEKVMHTETPYPDFYMIRQELEQISDRPDSLTSVFRPLTEHNLFVSREQTTWDSLVNRTIVIDIHELPALKELCVYFVLNEIYKQLMLMPDSKVNSKSQAREMRTIIVLDEAHHFLNNKKRVKILEDLIREIRSKGASVILLSQSPDDYDQAEFNFLELLEFVYVLNCNPSSPKFLQQVFGINLERAKKIILDLPNLSLGETYSRLHDEKLTKIKLCK